MNLEGLSLECFLLEIAEGMLPEFRALPGLSSLL